MDSPTEEKNWSNDVSEPGEDAGTVKPLGSVIVQ